MPVRELVRYTRPQPTRRPRWLLRQLVLECACVAACCAFLSRQDDFGLQRNERHRERSKTLACRFVWSATVTRITHARAHRSKHSRTVMTRVVDSHAMCNTTSCARVTFDAHIDAHVACKRMLWTITQRAKSRCARNELRERTRATRVVTRK